MKVIGGNNRVPATSGFGRPRRHVGRKRWRRDSNPCTRLCRPLPGRRFATRPLPRRWPDPGYQASARKSFSSSSSVSGFFPFCRFAGGAFAHAGGDDLESGAVQRPRNRGELRDDVLAVTPLLDHRDHAGKLALRAPQPIQHCGNAFFVTNHRGPFASDVVHHSPGGIRGAGEVIARSSRVAPPSVPVNRERPLLGSAVCRYGSFVNSRPISAVVPPCRSMSTRGNRRLGPTAWNPVWPN